MNDYISKIVGDFFYEWSGAFLEGQVPSNESLKGIKFFEDANALGEKLWKHGGMEALQFAIRYCYGAYGIPEGLQLAWKHRFK